MASASSTVKSEACERCQGVGLIRTERGSAPCPCQLEAAIAGRIRRAAIPIGFSAARFESYRPNEFTRNAFTMARTYAQEFPPAPDGHRGLMFHGTVGTGKTHLAASIAQVLAARGFQPLFVDVRELLERLKRSFDPKSSESESEIMAPVFKADLVIVDELGATRPTDWAFETIELLIGGLYNRIVPTIVTTNLPNCPAGGTETNEYTRAARPETLGDRIGARMFSRLQQMCRPFEMKGPDWRSKR